MNQTKAKPLSANSIGEWVRNNTNILLMIALIIAGALTSESWQMFCVRLPLTVCWQLPAL